MFELILYKDTIFIEIITQKSSFFTLIFSKTCPTYNTARKQSIFIPASLYCVWNRNPIITHWICRCCRSLQVVLHLSRGGIHVLRHIAVYFVIVIARNDHKF